MSRYVTVPQKMHPKATCTRESLNLLIFVDLFIGTHVSFEGFCINETKVKRQELRTSKSSDLWITYSVWRWIQRSFSLWYQHLPYQDVQEVRTEDEEKELECRPV